MKRMSLILVAAGALTAAALAGTTLASDGEGNARNASAPLTATASPSTSAPSAAPSPNAPSADPSSAPSTVGTPITQQRAVEIALSALGGGTLVEIEQETEHGRAMWSVRIGKDGIRHRVDVDRSTGEITRTEQAHSADKHGSRHGDHGSRHSGVDDGDGDDHGGRHPGSEDGGSRDRG